MGGTFDDSGIPHVHGDVAHSPHLIVLLECDRALGGSARYSLGGVDRINIGRGEARSATRHDQQGMTTLDVRLPGRSLSASHARLVRVGASWSIEDLDSKNGTFVNGQRVRHAVLAPEDLFEVGHVIMRVNPSMPMLLDAPLDCDSEAVTRDDPTTLDPALGARFKALAKIAPSGVPVLLLGDSGTGKELIARWVHARAGRRGEFVAVNCGAIPSALVESSFFGHVKGAFSGALRDEPGFVRTAQGGTLFLDEIADLPKPSQTALLRVLQEREVVPVGATRPIPVDIRIVAATHQSLDDMVASGAFRRDLYARVAGFNVRLLPLRERRVDFGLIVATILRKVDCKSAPGVSLAPDVGRALLSYDWPLNIRELEQCLAACLALAPDGRIELTHLPAQVACAIVAPPKHASPQLNTRDDGLRLDLLAQLARHRGNLAEVARAMGKARMQVHRWCKRFGVDPNAYRR
jgi:transcriptional regulator with PAS, ATPase and Fis domain